jgi:glycosyltransferase involved in cell wall biosynthesis
LTRTELFKTVLPSKIFEASATGKPIILGVEGFAAELVEAAEAGLCIEPENDGELVEALSKLASDRVLASTLGRNGFERIAERFDIERLAGEYLELLEGLTGRVARP